MNKCLKLFFILALVTSLASLQAMEGEFADSIAQQATKSQEAPLRQMISDANPGITESEIHERLDAVRQAIKKPAIVTKVPKVDTVVAAIPVVDKDEEFVNSLMQQDESRAPYDIKDEGDFGEEKQTLRQKVSKKARAAGEKVSKKAREVGGKVVKKAGEAADWLKEQKKAIAERWKNFTAEFKKNHPKIWGPKLRAQIKAEEQADIKAAESAMSDAQKVTNKTEMAEQLQQADADLKAASEQRLAKLKALFADEPKDNEAEAAGENNK